MQLDIPKDRLSSGPLREIRIDLTTRCNLRCVYCAVSQSTYQGADMPFDLARRAVALIGDVTRDQILPAIHVNGHGETTFLPGWVAICRSLLDQNMPLVMTSNLAKQFSAEEFDALARMETIMVSIDSADSALTRRIRRKVSLEHIVQNIEQIRQAAGRLHSPPPAFRISCGLYDKNTLGIEDLAKFAVANRIRGVGFWNLTSWGHDKFPYENTDVAPEDRAFPLDDLSNDDLRPRLRAIRSAMAILKDNRIQVHVNGEFLDSLERRLESGPSTGAKTRSHDLPPGTTRDCMDPWNYVQLNTNGDLQPCCAHSKVGNLNEAGLSEILNGAAIRRLRENLLAGTPDEECANCRLRAPIAPKDLQQQVLAMFKESAESENAFRSGRVLDLLQSALEDLRSGKDELCWSTVGKALAIDPGIQDLNGSSAEAVRRCLPRIVETGRFPLTFTWLADIFRHIDDNESAILLLKKFLELATEAPDRDYGLQGIRDSEYAFRSGRVLDLLQSALEDLRSGRDELVWPTVGKALAIDPGIQDLNGSGVEAVRRHLPRIIEMGRFPLTFSWLAAIFRHIQDNESAILLLKKYLELVPNAPDRDNVLQGIRDAEWTIQMAQNAPSSHDESPVENSWTRIRMKLRLRTRLRNWFAGRR